ncbi:kinase-like domain-containing protein [Mycena metata]|uniref:Kinase-like domain-containing protein n=1 Tax=Mycena metata TaxID=1033252 RepID=A0AAD7I5T3_9AGAR|nr:kinase-like domain-containing protein [Mycena metata]
MAKRPGLGTTHTTSSLLRHEHGGGAPGEEKVTVAWAVVISQAPKQTNADLGVGAQRWAVSVALPDIKSQLVDTVNVEWGRSNSTPLLNEEVTFRFHGSKVLEKNTENMILGDFYVFYSTPSRSPIYLASIPTAWKPMAKTSKGGTLYLKLYIDSAMFQTRVELSEGAQSVDSMIDSTTASVIRKRTLSSVSEAPMGSRFQPTNPKIMEVHKRSSVTLKKVVCVVDDVNGVVELEDTGEIITGAIRDVYFARGAMKNAHDFKTEGGHSLVAKHFYRISDTAEAMAPPLSVSDHRLQIVLELQHLASASNFLKEFFHHAKECSVNVHAAIAIADAWVGEEILHPSVASGTSKIDATHGGLTWLVEGKRPTTVEHFTFTLNHQTRRHDLCAQTIHAFAHFVYGHSNKHIVIADIQGTPAHINGQDMMVLLDPMTHAASGDSGIGDFGKPGIQTFIRDHKCGDVCRALDLEKSVPLTLDNMVPLPAEGSDGDEDSLIRDLVNVGSQPQSTQSTDNPTKNIE